MADINVLPFVDTAYLSSRLDERFNHGLLEILSFINRSSLFGVQESSGLLNMRNIHLRPIKTDILSLITRSNWPFRHVSGLSMDDIVPSQDRCTAFHKHLAAIKLVQPATRGIMKS